MPGCTDPHEYAFQDPRLLDALELLVTIVQESYVVGGALRDYVLRLTQNVDLDVAVKGDGFQIARELARIMGRRATFVPLDRDRGTGRIVLTAHPKRSMDISSFKGETIHDDLRARDFTINALALDTLAFLGGDFGRIIDPMGGREDLRVRLVRECSPSAFAEDPVRILRAFRFAVGLDFRLSEETKATIAGHVDLLRLVAPERIRDELFAILSSSRCSQALGEMEDLAVLTTLFPELRPMKGCTQNWFHHLDVWVHTLTAISKLEEIATFPDAFFGELTSRVRSYLHEELVVGRPRIALVKLAALFHDAGKPSARIVDPDGRIRFFGHDKISAEVFEEAGKRLRLATREMRTVREWIAGHMRPGILTDPDVTRRAMYRLCHKFEKEVIGLLVLFLADLAASQGPARRPGEDRLAVAGVQKALDFCFTEKIRTARLLDGRDLIAMLGLREGPQVGSILRKLAELQGSGEICTRQQAIEAARHLVEAQGGPEPQASSGGGRAVIPSRKSSPDSL